MARAKFSNDSIENVQIVHAEGDLEAVIRPLAKGLEQHLKLPGQADYDRQAEFSPDYITDQMKKVIDMKVYSVLYISDELLKIFKKKKKFTEIFKSVLKKDKETNGETKNIVILWGNLKDQDLAKKVLGLDISKVHGSYLSDLQLDNYSLNETGNLVEATLRIWKGPDAVLPGKQPSSSTSEAKQIPVIEEASPVNVQRPEPLDVPPFSELSIVHFRDDLKFVSELGFFLMLYLKLQTSPHYYTFCNNESKDIIGKILKQLRDFLQDGHQRLVVMITGDLLDLLKNSREDAANFEQLCCTAVAEKSTNIVFLLKNVTVEDVREFSTPLGDDLLHRCHIFEGKDNLEGAAFSLKRILNSGKTLEAEENDESVVYRTTKEEYANHKGNMVASNGDSIHIDAKKPMFSFDISPQTFVQHPKKIQETKTLSSDEQSSHHDSLRSVSQSLDHGRACVPEVQSSGGPQSLGGSDSKSDKSGGNNVEGFSAYFNQQQMKQTDLSATSGASAGDRTIFSENKPRALSSKVNGDFSQGSVPLSGSSQLLDSKQKDGGHSKKPLQSKEQDSAPPPYTSEQQNTIISGPSSQPLAMPYHPPSNTVNSVITPTQQHGAVYTQPVSPISELAEVAAMLSNPDIRSKVEFILRSQQLPTFAPATYGVHTQFGGYAQQPFWNGPVLYSQIQPPTGMPAQVASANQSQPEHFLKSPQQIVSPTQPASAYATHSKPENLLRSQQQPQIVSPTQPASTYATSNQSEQTSQSTRLTQLPTKVKHELELKLNVSKLCGMYWKHFAEQIGVTPDEIGVWESQSNINFMRKLFEWIGTNNEDYTVWEFKKLATHFNRPDVVKILHKHGY